MNIYMHIFRTSLYLKQHGLSDFNFYIFLYLEEDISVESVTSKLHIFFKNKF